MPKVSIIIATHSRPHLLPRAVHSAQAAGSDVEVVVVDDASTDATAQVCRELKDITYIRAERNQRTAGARNLGMLAGSGEYIGFLDDDDLRLPGSLDLQIMALAAAPTAGFVYGQALKGDQNCNPTHEPPDPATCPVGDIFWQLLERNFLHCLTVVFRRSCLYQIGLLRPELAGIDDSDLWIRLAELYPAAAVAQPVAIWRTPTPGSAQGSSHMAAQAAFAARVHAAQWMKLPRVVQAPAGRQREVRQRFLDHTTDMLLWNAAHAWPQGHAHFARRNIRTALRLNPRRTMRPATFALLARSFTARPARPRGVPRRTAPLTWDTKETGVGDG